MSQPIDVMPGLGQPPRDTGGASSTSQQARSLPASNLHCRLPDLESVVPQLINGMLELKQPGSGLGLGSQ